MPNQQKDKELNTILNTSKKDAEIKRQLAELADQDIADMQRWAEKSYNITNWLHTPTPDTPAVYIQDKYIIIEHGDNQLKILIKNCTDLSRALMYIHTFCKFDWVTKDMIRQFITLIRENTK